jgi:hypothetical protein
LRTEPPDRQPVLIAGGLIIGIVVALVAVPRLFGGTDPRVENYILLASQLHAQGENPLVLRDRLLSVGVSNPPATVLQMAQRYAQSRDRKQQHQAEALEAFGKVLLNPPADTARPTPTTRPDEPSPPPTATPLPTNTPILLSRPGEGVPTAPALAAPSPTGAARPSVTPSAGQAAPAAGATPTAAAPPAGTVQRGRIKPPDGGSARLRKDPNTTGGTLSLIPNAAQVEILEVVQGQPIEGESRWLRVRYGNMTGYLWSRLVAVGD